MYCTELQWNLVIKSEIFGYILFSNRHVYKFRQRNLFFSKVPKVDLFDFGTKLFNL